MVYILNTDTLQQHQQLVSLQSQEGLLLSKDKYLENIEKFLV